MWPTFFIHGLARGSPVPSDTDCWFQIQKATATARSYSDGESLDPELQLTLPAGLYRVVGELRWRGGSLAGNPGPGFAITSTVEPNVYESWSSRLLNTFSAYLTGSADAVPMRPSVGTRSNYDIAQLTTVSGGTNAHQISHIDQIISVPSEAGVGVLWGQVASAAAGQYILDVGSWLAFKDLNPT